MLVGRDNSEIVRRDPVLVLLRCRSLLRIPLAVVTFCAPLSGQAVESRSPSELVFGEEIDVRVVNLEVVVEDRSGARVRGLSREDFRILVDGQEVDVQYFSEVAGGRAVTGDGGRDAAGGCRRAAVATNYLLFVDDAHTHVTSRRPVLLGFGSRLGGLGPHDQVAVVVRSRYRLEILSRFTADRDVTRAALAELDTGGRYGGFFSWWGWHKRMRRLDLTATGDSLSSREDVAPRGTQPRGTQPRIDATPPVSAREADGPAPPGGFSAGDDGMGSPGAFGAVGGPGTFDRISEDLTPGWGLDMATAASQMRDLQFSVDAVVTALRALEAPQGRKVLLLLTGSWPNCSYAQVRWMSECRGVGKARDFELLDALVDTANLLGWTVYPMDQQGGANMALWGNLRYVARDTGGRAFMAGSNVKALDKVRFDTANYYWLGFVPRYRRDNQAHDIRVEVSQRRLRVRSRRGYLDLSRQAEADMEALRALLFPSHEEPDAGFLLVEVGEVADGHTQSDARASDGLRASRQVPRTTSRRSVPAGTGSAVCHCGPLRSACGDPGDFPVSRGRLQARPRRDRALFGVAGDAPASPRARGHGA